MEQAGRTTTTRPAATFQFIIMLALTHVFNVPCMFPLARAINQNRLKPRLNIHHCALRCVEKRQSGRPLEHVGRLSYNSKEL